MNLATFLQLLYEKQDLYCRLQSVSLPDVSVRVGEESPQDVDRQNAQPTFRLDVHYGEHRLVQDGVPHVLGGVRIRGNLWHMYNLYIQYF